MGRKTFFLAKQQKHLQSTPLAEPVRTVYVLAMYAHFFAVFGWSQKKTPKLINPLRVAAAPPGPGNPMPIETIHRITLKKKVKCSFDLG